MNRNGTGNGMPGDARSDDRGGRPFLGFTPLDANFLFCPNQFLDLCLPYHSRGCVRLVGYLFRKTLGWRDEFGRPKQQRIPVPYQQLIDEAGISRGAIRDAIDEAVKACFITCTQEGHAHVTGKAAKSSRYELRWDHAPEFVKEPAGFNGFFAGDGHRTPIPNDFFDVVIPGESLAVIRVVGAIIRRTIGYQDQFGGRRAAAPLSLSQLQKFSQMGDRKTISDAIHHAIESNYIVLVREGTFDPSGGERNMAAAYGIKWSKETGDAARNGSKTPPATDGPTVQKSNRPRKPAVTPETQVFSEVIGSFFPPVPQGSIGSKTPPVSVTVQKPHRQQSKNPTGNGSKTQLLERGYERVLEKEQQQPVAVDDAYQILREVGFDVRNARKIADVASLEQVCRQIQWLDRRTATRNKLGLLRQSILEDWAEPMSPVRTSEVQDSPTGRFARGFYAGLGDNKGKPVAEPSANDLAAAERFIERTVDIVTADNAEMAGRTFGMLVREWRGTNNAVNSLVVCLRSYGDKFVVRLESQVRAAKTAQAQKDAQEREVRLKADYASYLLTMEEVLRKAQPENAKRFEAWRDRQREQTASQRFATKHLLAYFDSEEKRLADFATFFERDVLNFKSWMQNRTNEGDQT